MIPWREASTAALGLESELPPETTAASQYAFNKHLWNTSHWAGAGEAVSWSKLVFALRHSQALDQEFGEGVGIKMGGI